MTVTLIRVTAEEVQLDDLVLSIDGDVLLATPIRVDYQPEAEGEYMLVHMVGLGSPRYRKGTRFQVERKDPPPVPVDGMIVESPAKTRFLRVGKDDWRELTDGKPFEQNVGYWDSEIKSYFEDSSAWKVLYSPDGKQ